MIIVSYVTIGMIACVGIYAACRAISHVFEKKEIASEAEYVSGMIDQATQNITWLTDEMLKKINDALLTSFKQEGES